MTLREKLVARAFAEAQKWPAYTGQPTAQNKLVTEVCKWRFDTVDTVHVLLFTRDEGMHSSGWWKNPDYERCWHLSLSFRDRQTLEGAPHNHREAERWCQLFWPTAYRLLWIEPPFSDEGKKWDVYHYRLFVAPDWRTPLLPRGEVYTREFTEAGWKSWSDLHAEPQESAHT